MPKDIIQLTQLLTTSEFLGLDELKKLVLDQII
jgi:hypothetical protein